MSIFFFSIHFSRLVVDKSSFFLFQSSIKLQKNKRREENKEDRRTDASVDMNSHTGVERDIQLPYEELEPCCQKEILNNRREKEFQERIREQDRYCTLSSLLTCFLHCFLAVFDINL